MPRLQAAKPKQTGLCSCPRGFSRLCLPALLFWLLCTAAPGRDKPQRAPQPRTAPNNNSQHPGTLSNAQAAATAPICPDRQSRPLPGAALFCCRGSSVLLSLLHRVSVLSSDFCEYALLHPGLCFGTGPGWGCSHLHSSGSEPFLPACLRSLPQETVEIISGEPLEIILCS